MRQRSDRLAIIPAGYGQAVAGAAVFAAGGVGDMVWHQLFGVEFGIDALLSPTHLALFAGGALLFSGPIRAARLRRGASSPWTGLPAVLSGTAIAAVAAFALSYLSGFLADQATVALSHAPEGTAEHITSEAMASAGLASYLVTSRVMVTPLASLIRHGLALPGAATFLVVSLAVLASVVLADFPNPGVILAAAVAGVLADVALFGVGDSVPPCGRGSSSWLPCCPCCSGPASSWLLAPKARFCGHRRSRSGTAGGAADRRVAAYPGLPPQPLHSGRSRQRRHGAAVLRTVSGLPVCWAGSRIGYWHK